MKLKWDDLHIQSRQYILVKCCMNLELAHYSWNELDTWIQQLITEVIIELSNNKVKVGI